jgi:hypothetical protein
MEKLLGDPRANQSDLIRAFLNLRHDASLLDVKDLHIDGRKAGYGVAPPTATRPCEEPPCSTSNRWIQPVTIRFALSRRASS